MTETAPDSARTRSIPFVTLALLSAYALSVVVIVGAVLIAKPGGTGAAGVGPVSSTLQLTLTEFKIEGSLTAPAGPVKLEVTNKGSADHNITSVDLDKATADLGPGQSEILDLGELAPGEYEIDCSVAGHKEAGMVATLTIVEAGSEAASAGMAHSGSATEADYKKMDADMISSFAAFPAETEGVGNQPLEFTMSPDGYKEATLTASIGEWEVAPGQVVESWMYNGTVPGPAIKLDVGDKVRITFKNELPVLQDIHWHGLEVPFEMDGVAPVTQTPVESGSEFVYEFTVDRPYQGMYHPHIHGEMGIPNGMWGTIQAGPTPTGAGQTINGITIPANVQPAVDIPMVINDSGTIGMSLNGKSFPATAPIVVNEGEWVAVTYYNEGAQSHPMHLHQFPQLVVAQDGFPLASPYAVDTLLIAPGQRYTVMFQATRKGTWVWHCHILPHVERETGMFGMVTAVVVQ